ncbi:hypothetical protein M1O29_02010 [Dehalococcoidia bacterium]|nr:hypothetical protein [Dehalococcoidia bacterium]
MTTSTALAHGYVERFSPPLPLAWYLAAAGSAVILSFAISHLIARSPNATTTLPSYSFKFGQMLIPNTALHFFVVVSFRLIILIVQIVSVALLTLTIWAGFAGNQSPIHNFSPTFVWVIFWVAIPIACALVGNIWRTLNPWEAVFKVIEAPLGRIRTLLPYSLQAQYQPQWGVWPAIILFLIFAWIENIYPDSIVPSNLATAVVAYSIITWTGMFIFGRESWLLYGDPFSVLFRLLSRCSIVEPSVASSTHCRDCPELCQNQDEDCRDCATCFAHSSWASKRIGLRIFGSGVIRGTSASITITIFVLLVLSTMTLDGFLATTIWADLRRQLLEFLPNVTVIGSLALLAAPMVFYVAYQIFMNLSSYLGRLPLTGRSTGSIYAITLLPIAVAYHIAHFHYFLLVQGQAIIPLISDPFGFGWDLFGTTDYRINVTILSPNTSWLFTVIIIVAGHIIAVYAAHALARRQFGPTTGLIRGQAAILGLMTGYTVLSLWVMGQPMMR